MILLVVVVVVGVASVVAVVVGVVATAATAAAVVLVLLSASPFAHVASSSNLRVSDSDHVAPRCSANFGELRRKSPTTYEVRCGWSSACDD